MKETEETLIEGLKFAQIPELPEKWDEKNVWVKALAKVRRCNNKVEFVVVKNNGSNKPSIIKSFGTVSAVHEFMEIYPFELLSPVYIPEFRNKAEIINYLVSKFGENQREKLMEMKNSDLKSLVRAAAIQDQTAMKSCAEEDRKIKESKNKTEENGNETLEGTADRSTEQAENNL